MAKCIRCGKKGFFLKVNSSGVCVDCQKDIEEQIKRIEEKKRQEMEARQKKIASIPHFKIVRNGEKKKVVITAIVNDISYSNVNTRSSIKKFLKFVVLDIETSGLSLTRNDVLEISAIKFDSFEPVEIFHTYIKPNKKEFKNEAADINKITYSDVEDAPYIYEIIPSLQTFICDMPIIGHNLEFDLKFLIRHGLDITVEKRKFYDTMKIAKKILKSPKYVYDEEFDGYYPDLEKEYDVEDYKLETLCDYYGIQRTAAHTGIGDCVDTVILFKALLAEKIEDDRLVTKL